MLVCVENTRNTDLCRAVTERTRKELGKGEKLQDILDTLGSTAEGVSSAGLVETIAQKHGIDIPIIKLVGATLRGEIAPKDLAKTLMSRPLREEF